jgi:sugar lactone lactonase YvrE
MFASRVFWILAACVMFAAKVAHGQQAIVDHFTGPAGGAGSRDGRGEAARFFGPTGIATDGTYLYVADTQNHTIRKISIATGEVTRIAGSTQQRGILQSGVPQSGVLISPAAAWSDGSSLYFYDRLLRRLTMATGELTTFLGPGEGPTLTAITGNATNMYGLSARVMGGRGGSFIQAAIHEISLSSREWRRLNLPLGPEPTGLWADGQFLYIAYPSRPGSVSVARLNLSNSEYTLLFGHPQNGEPTYSPLNLWGDGRGNLFFSDQATIYRLSLITGELTPVATSPQATHRWIGGLTGWGDTLFATDSRAHVVFRVDLRTQQTTTVAGKAITDPFNARAVWSDGQSLYAISGQSVYRISIASREIAVLAGGFANPLNLTGKGQFLYVLDAGNQSIERIDLRSGEVVRFADRVNMGYGLWADDRYLYATDELSSSHIRRIDLNTRESTALGDGSRTPHGIWGDGTYLYVADTFNCLIRRFDLAGLQSTVLAGNVTTCSTIQGNPPPIIDGIGTAASFSEVWNVWGAGNQLYLTDRGTLRVIDTRTGETRTIAGHPQILGTEDGVGTEARLMLQLANVSNRLLRPAGLWTDGTTVYVADTAIRRARLPVPADNITFDLENPGGSYWNASSGASEPLRTFYGRLQPDAGSSLPAGIAIFGFRSNGVLVSEAAVPASPLVREGRIFVEMNGPVNTGVAIANPNPQQAIVSFYFSDAQGVTLASGTLPIAPNAQVSAFLNEPQFYLPGFRFSPAEARSFTFISSLPVGAIALRGYTNERSDFLMTTLPIARTDRATTESIVVPHFADGGGWRTQVLLVNPTDQVITGTVVMGSAFEYAIAPRSATKIATPGSGSTITTGSLRVSASIGAVPVVSTVFSFVQSGITVTESGVATTGTSNAFRLFAETGQARTGVAVANTTSAAAIVQFELFDLNGQFTDSASVTIEANAQLPLFVDEIPGLDAIPVPFRGVLRISSSASISAVGLRGRYNERGDFLVAATPAIAEDGQTAPGEFIFPHIVSGDGYTTEFLLLSGSGAASGAVQFFSPSGARVSIPVATQN